MSRYRRALSGLFAAGAIVLFIYQLKAINDSLFRIGHPYADAGAVRYITTIPSDVETILSIARKHGHVKPRVLMGVVYWEQLPWLIALHYGYAQSREQMPSEGDVSRWTLRRVRYETPKSTTSANGVSYIKFQDHDVIWLKDHNAQMARQLDTVVDDPACRSGPADHIYIRPEPTARYFICVPLVPAPG